jgi:hypothetical protein
MSLDTKLEIKKQIAELEKKLKRLRELDNSHLDFSKINNIQRHTFDSLAIDFRKIVTCIHFLKTEKKNIYGEDIVELEKYRVIKMRELTKEQTQESNELLQKMLEPFAEKIKEKLKQLSKNP